MTPAPGIQDLITEVQRDAPDDQPLTHLRTAAGMMQTVTEAADATLGYFVDQARRAGHSWAEIGEALGVSKQAAQQRHVRVSDDLRTVTFERFTDRARKVVAMSDPLARDLGHSYVGTEHLLLAQFSEPEGLAAKVLVEQGLTRQTVVDAIAKATGTGATKPEGAVPLTPKAKATFTAALAVAVELGHNYIGTEHLLLATFRIDGLARTILLDNGIEEEAAKARVLELLAGFVATKAAAPAKKAPPAKRAARKRK